MTIWIVCNAQGPIQAYEARNEAEEFIQRSNEAAGAIMTTGWRVVSCALVLRGH